ncbi:XRE family transcriptional regulator [Lactococcus lactis subsp. lactis]|uniref:helix-turn-helix domain-containing protein n=1 Tax=Lactococcus lactis TaxID=1358 RepID=UPI00223A760D|nr:helix-turn-helix transcriptional regulator [Lactococcus lactis]MCT0035401.1 XRE family transcriptional regulator [Lactococcus lactis subsp. lactis]
MENNIKGRIGNLGNKETMSQNLKRLLSSRGLNPHQFSEIMNFKYTTVMNWINANTYPRIDKIEMMAQYFGINKSDLVEEFDPKIKPSSSQERLDNLFDSLNISQREQLFKLAKYDLDDNIFITVELMSNADSKFRDKVASFAKFSYFEYEKELEQKNKGNQNSAS